jgi:hypothetical protein
LYLPFLQCNIEFFISPILWISRLSCTVP